MPQHCVHETAAPGLFLAFHEEQQIHAELARSQQVRSRTSDGEHRTLVVSDTARIQITIAGGQRERVALPSLGRSGDHVVVAVRMLHVSLGTVISESSGSALRIEEDAWFPSTSLRALEARKDGRVMYRRLVRIKLFDTLCRKNSRRR